MDDDVALPELDVGLVLELEDEVLVDPAEVGVGSASAPSLQLVTASAAARLAAAMAAFAYPVKTLPISTRAASPVAAVRHRV
ncbi:hypothetical protein [Pedococcus cremeus]|uniref:hypothetical protein n=1 Tax=Pedococcus cremeus TaxID=587636 RepID=UPI00115FE65C|nr:hypothetical protein [Pedococcus cremeus]